MKTLLIAFVVFLSVIPAWAQTVNPSTASWTAPTTNNDPPIFSPLTDLALYNLRVAGPFAITATCPAYALAAYPTKATLPSPVTTPLPATTLTFGTAGSHALAANLNLTVDGLYCLSVTAQDTTGNESGGSNLNPFLRNVVPPSAPSGLQLNP